MSDNVFIPMMCKEIYIYDMTSETWYTYDNYHNNTSDTIQKRHYVISGDEQKTPRALIDNVWLNVQTKEIKFNYVSKPLPIVLPALTDKEIEEIIKEDDEKDRYPTFKPLPFEQVVSKRGDITYYRLNLDYAYETVYYFALKMWGSGMNGAGYSDGNGLLDYCNVTFHCYHSASNPCPHHVNWIGEQCHYARKEHGCMTCAAETMKHRISRLMYENCKSIGTNPIRLNV